MQGGGLAEHKSPPGSFLNTQNAQPTWVCLLDQNLCVGVTCSVKPTLQGLQSYSLWHKPVFRPDDL